MYDVEALLAHGFAEAQERIEASESRRKRVHRDFLRRSALCEARTAPSQELRVVTALMLAPQRHEDLMLAAAPVGASVQMQDLHRLASLHNRDGRRDAPLLEKNLECNAPAMFKGRVTSGVGAYHQSAGRQTWEKATRSAEGQQSEPERDAQSANPVRHPAAACCNIAARRAAPRSAVYSFRMTRTGIASSTVRKRPLFAKAFRNRTVLSFGRIFGGIPPPM